MSRTDYKTCRHCGRHTDECGPLSHSRACLDCATARQTVNIVFMGERTGDVWLNWRRQVAASVGAVLLDDLERST